MAQIGAFLLSIVFDEIIAGENNGEVARTVGHVCIKPKRNRDRRRSDTQERANSILKSLRSYLMALDYEGKEKATGDD